MNEWYYGIGDRQHGPVNDETFQALSAAVTITPMTLVWKEGMADWQALHVIRHTLPLNHSPYAPSVYGGQPAYASPYQQPSATSGLAIASMVCGILGVLTCFLYIPGIGGLAAVICGHLGMSSIRKATPPLSGKGMCIAGLIMGYLSLLIQLVIIIGGIWLFQRIINDSPQLQNYRP